MAFSFSSRSSKPLRDIIRRRRNSLQTWLTRMASVDVSNSSDNCGLRDRRDFQYCNSATSDFSLLHEYFGVNGPSLGWLQHGSRLARYHRFSTEAKKGVEEFSDEQPELESQNQFLEFPGGNVGFTYEMNFIPEISNQRVPCYRILDDYGHQIAKTGSHEVGKDLALKIYNNMVTLQVMDTIFYEAQRQGRISFYVNSHGEEAINIAAAAALSAEDIVFPQYREPGILIWRGFTLQEFANQCFGNSADYGKGRQMPIHYGTNALNYFTISSPVATQIPQAVGAAYSLKMDKKEACAITFFGDGGSSEGDFHAALNIAAALEAPVVFFCRNNGWAISTPASEQFRSDGIVVRGQGYGMRSIRVDGNDALAIYSAVSMARRMAIDESRPILIEALTYRVGHHSTSDDSTKYRRVDEIEHWKTMRDPVSRFRKWLHRNNWWTDMDESDLRAVVRNKMLQAIQIAESMQKPSIANLFSDVYDNVPPNLLQQERQLRETVARHPEDYPADVPL